MSTTVSIARGVIGSFILTAATILVTLLQLRLAVHYLPSGTAGVWILFLTLGNYIAFLDLGLSPTLAREISFATGAKISDADRAQRIANLIATCRTAFSQLAGITFIVAVLAGEVFFWRNPATRMGHLHLSWLVFCAGASLNLLGASPLAILYGSGKVATERIIRAAALTIYLVIAYVVLRMGYGILGLAAAWSIQGILTRSVALHFTRRLHLIPAIKGHFSTSALKTFAAPSLKLAAVQLGAILILQTSNVVIAVTIGPTAIPSYEAIAKLATTLMTLSLLIVNSSVPFISRAHSAADLDQQRNLLSRNLRCGMAIMVVLTSFVAVYGDRIIAVWLGPQFYAGRLVLATMLLMVLLEVHHVIFAAAMMATGRIVFVWTALFAGILNVSLAFALVPYLHLWGVALATLIAQLTTNNWYAPYITMRAFRIGARHYFRKIAVPIVALGLVQTGMNFAMRSAPITSQFPPLVALALAFTLSALIGGGFAWFLALEEAERESLWLRFTSPSRAKVVAVGE